MILFVLESLGTWELMLIGMVALMVFGPRKIPELARKAGKIMHEFRKVSNDFRSTWEREAGLDDSEKNAFNFNEESILNETSPEAEHPALKDADVDTSPQEELMSAGSSEPDVPEIKEVTDSEKLEELRASAAKPVEPVEKTTDKENWF
ncbi:MAG: twin-arginine translocase TatA/TatE family subunit [Pyrinomonadaceae bacterium]|nr:twin-arginine translocase TatA/TatE family subunit [Pyrinomonadaceae bacterium]